MIIVYPELGNMINSTKIQLRIYSGKKRLLISSSFFLTVWFLSHLWSCFSITYKILKYCKVPSRPSLLLTPHCLFRRPHTELQLLSMWNSTPGLFLRYRNLLWSSNPYVQFSILYLQGNIKYIFWGFWLEFFKLLLSL